MLWHNPQVVVLLLLIAIQRKPNEDIIAKITTLDFWIQRDLKYYIESGLGKANCHTLMAGGFTSGGYMREKRDMITSLKSCAKAYTCMDTNTNAQLLVILG